VATPRSRWKTGSFPRTLRGRGGPRQSNSERETKGMRGRQRWFNPSSASPWIQYREDRKRSWREHSTHTVLGSRVAHSEVRVNAMRGGGVGGDVGFAAGEVVFEGDPP